jgi:hypothetical protein
MNVLEKLPLTVLACIPASALVIKIIADNYGSSAELETAMKVVVFAFLIITVVIIPLRLIILVWRD